MHTATSIHIRAPREAVFSKVRNLTRWPEYLPHYRFVTMLGREAGREIVRMSARRSGLPITWVASYEASEQSLELRFEHLRAWTKGMRVVWTLTPTRDGTRVEIVHDLRFRWRPLAWLAELVIGGFFIDHIARKTLATFKSLLEAELSASPEAAGAEDQSEGKA